LASFAVAEQLYDALIVWSNEGSLTVTDVSFPFFQQFDTSITPGTYQSSTPTYSTLTTAIKNFADGFVAMAAKYTPSNGELAEQYTRSDGTPTSALDLTWSYASALTAFNARAGKTSASWGAAGLPVSPACSTSKALTVPVVFNVNVTTVLGRELIDAANVTNLFNSTACREHILDWLCRCSDRLEHHQCYSHVLSRLPNLEQCV
jgi:glucoamylase